MQRIRLILIPSAVVLGVLALVAASVRNPVRTPHMPILAGDIESLASTVERVNGRLAANWQKLELPPAGPAPELQVLRRLSLALHGTIPSLEELREFQADAGPLRLERWTRRMLSDRRFSDYFAEIGRAHV